MKSLVIRAAMVGAAMCMGATAANAQQAVEDSGHNRKYENFNTRHVASKSIDVAGSEGEYYARSMRVAKCIQSAMGEETGALIDTNWDNRGQAKLEEALATTQRGCVNTEINGLPVDFISMALVESVLAAKQNDLLSTPPTADRAAAQAYIVGSADDAPIRKVGRCIAVLAPVQVFKLMRTPLMSEEETAALKEAYATAQNCGVKDVPEIDPMVQRRAMVEGLYSWRMNDAG